MARAFIARLRRWADGLRRDVLALWLAARDPRVPWMAKLSALVAAGYALSPIDLIPDFVPVLGYLDDLIIVPCLVLLAVRLIPPAVLDELREVAARRQGERPRSLSGAAVVIAVWTLVGVVILHFLNS